MKAYLILLALLSTVECRKGSDFMGACRSAVQGGGGYEVQTALFYYTGHSAGTPAQVQQICKLSNGEYIAQ